MNYVQWLDQANQLTLVEEMVGARRPPAEIALHGEERLHDKRPPVGHASKECGHPCPVKIIEHQNCIKDADFRPLCFQIHETPVYVEAPLGGTLPTGGELFGVAVERRHPGAECCGSEGVATLA